MLLRATDNISGSAPNITCVVKGLIIDVPSNYNQPIIDRPRNKTEIDWRELETNIDDQTA